MYTIAKCKCVCLDHLLKQRGWVQQAAELSTCRRLPPVVCYPSHEAAPPASVIDGVYGNSTSITAVMGSWYCEWENVDAVKSTLLPLWIVFSNYPELTIYLLWWLWQSGHIIPMAVPRSSSHIIWSHCILNSLCRRRLCMSSVSFYIAEPQASWSKFKSSLHYMFLGTLAASHEFKWGHLHTQSEGACLALCSHLPN